jgi:hypothetical protein
MNNYFDRGRHRATPPRPPSLYLVATLLTIQAPLAEVLTVVGHESIVVFAYSRARPVDHLRTVED